MLPGAAESWEESAEEEYIGFYLRFYVLLIMFSLFFFSLMKYIFNLLCKLGSVAFTLICMGAVAKQHPGFLTCDAVTQG